MSTTQISATLILSKRTPDLHKQLSRILCCLEDYESAVSETEVESALSSFSQLYKVLPGDLPEMYSLLCTIGRAIEDTQNAMKNLSRIISDKEVTLQAEELSVDAKRNAKKRLALGPEREAGRKVKQDFLMFANSWFYEISFTLRPYWTQSVVDVINTHHQPASDHLGFARTQGQLITTIQQIRMMTGEVVN